MTRFPSPLTHTSRQRGQTMLIAIFFFIIISLLIILGLATPVIDQLAHAKRTLDSLDSYYASEALIEDVVYRYKNALNVDETEALTINDATAEAIITTTSEGKEILSAGDMNNMIRTLSTVITLGSGVSFNFGVQAGEGGIELKNTSEVVGNAFSNGPITGSGNIIRGSVVSAGPTGLVDDIHATGTVHSHTITDAWIEEDAHYAATTTITNTVVEGIRYPESGDQATSSLPISDETITEWENGAEEGGVNDCGGNAELTIDSNTTLGPVKITCDLVIEKNNFTLSLAGPVWVTGSITVNQGPIIEVDSSLDGKSVAIIADDPTNRASGSQITLDNTAEFNGDGDNSYILLLSQNNDAENGGSTPAIFVANQAQGELLVYAGHGMVELQNNVSLREVTAYKIQARNSTRVIYETGMANLLFDAGPSGGYDILSWDEVE